VFDGFDKYFVLNFLLITMDMECNNAALGLYSHALLSELRSVGKVQKIELEIEDHKL